MHKELEDINRESAYLLAKLFDGRYTEEYLCGKADHVGWGRVLCELDVDDFRVCSECGALMHEGYCVDMGYAHYCSDKCLHKHFTDEEWCEECKTNSQSYWTDWYEHYGKQSQKK